jgi:hypothetical protein
MNGLPIEKARLVPVTSVKPGDWLCFARSDLNKHIVAIDRDGDTLTIACNFGEGYPGMVSFYSSDEFIYLA